jgi:hypothetical protein
VPKLSEVLGSLLRDLAESRVAADSLSKQYADAYSQDPLLSHFPVPRISVKDVTLRLRFAVAEQVIAQPNVQDKEFIDRLWAERVAGAMLPSLLAAMGAADQPEVADRLNAKIAQLAASRDLAISSALSGSASEATRRTVALLVSARNSLPAKLRAKLPADRIFTPAAQRGVREALAEFVPKAQRIVAARAALRSELDIVIAKAELQQVPESQVQELTVTLGADDIHLAGPPSLVGK